MNGDMFDASPATRRRFLASASAAAILLAAGCSDGTDDSKTPGAGKTPAAAAKEKKGMDFAELIEARRSVRRYAASAMPEGEMQKIVADCEDLQRQLPKFMAGYFAYLKGKVRDSVCTADKLHV